MTDSELLDDLTKWLQEQSTIEIQAAENEQARPAEVLRHINRLEVLHEVRQYILTSECDRLSRAINAADIDPPIRVSCQLGEEAIVIGGVADELEPT